ncbi:MAG: hypothetical protein KKD74_01875 [Bacteroidetes bacterium]|nr:hypothetical protein [Bacteroidota bacterium]
MKKITGIFSLMLLLAFAVSTSLTAQQDAPKKVLDIYYAHSTNRCPTCKAIEAQTRETLETQFKTEINAGTLVLHIINIDLKENKELVEQYKIWGSSLFLVKRGDEERTDLTKEGFAMARTKPEEFRTLLAKTIREKLAM